MTTNANSRTRLLCLVEILTTYSDELNILSAEEICEKLKEYGYEVTKRNLLSDIKAINTTSFNVISVNKPKKGYYLAKSYSPTASHLILEAIFSSDMLSTEDIEYTKTYLRRSICIPSLELVLNTTRNFNDLSSKRDVSIETLYNLRIAIRDKKKVAINISRMLPSDTFSRPKKFENLVVTPLFIAVANGSISLTFIRDSEQQNAEFVNVSRIRSAVVTSEAADKFSGNTNKISSYYTNIIVRKEQFSERWIIIEFRNSDIEIVESYFSAPVQYRKSDKEGFCLAKVNTIINRNLIGWLFFNSDKIKIIAPDSLAELFKDKAKNIL